VVPRVTTPGLTGEKERLPPAGAVAKFNERVKRIGKVNSEIADWLQVWFWFLPDSSCDGRNVYTLAGASQGRRGICRGTQEAGPEAIAGSRRGTWVWCPN
jgi:hypothetical protein